MRWMRWSAVMVAVLLGGWMLFDGTRALTIGDYVTPATGEHAGQLGPWRKVVERAGIEPRARGMKLGFVVLGGWWLAAAAVHSSRRRAGAWALAAASLASLWYLPFGTVLGLAELVLLWRSGALAAKASTTSR